MHLKKFTIAALLNCLAGAFLLFFSSSLSFAGTCPDNMLAYWGLEEPSPPYKNSVPTDSGVDAACASHCPEQIDGVVSRANRFDAQNDTGLRVPGAPFNWSGSDNFSIELWLRIDHLPGGDQVLVGRTDGAFYWNITIGSDSRIRFQMSDSQNALLLESSRELSTSASSLGSRWHHVAVTRNGLTGETKLFVDDWAPVIDTAEFQGGFSSDATPLAIGWSGDASNAQRFSGSLDEIAIYQRTIDAEEILGHYYLARSYCEMFDYPINIMPLGNSITFDQFRDDILRNDGDRSGYRYPLWQSLTNDQYWFDFIGSERSGYNIDPEFDPDNAGFPGITTSEMIELLQTSVVTAHNDNRVVEGGTRGEPYLNNFTIDVVLLHIGTNETALENVADVSTILDEIDRYSPRATVIVARIIHNTDDFMNGEEIEGNLTHEFNERVSLMVDERIAAGDKLIKVDMEDGAGLLYRDELTGPPWYVGEDMEDDLHPNASGYAKMAVQWYTQLQNFLPKVELPKITSTPNQTATANRPYQYQVTASGAPSPGFRLDKAPEGMKIDAQSGLIAWSVPDIAGKTVNVSVAAYQDVDATDIPWFDEDVQEFTIQITSQDEQETNGGGGGCFIDSLIKDNQLIYLIKNIQKHIF